MGTQHNQKLKQALAAGAEKKIAKTRQKLANTKWDFSVSSPTKTLCQYLFSRLMLQETGKLTVKIIAPRIEEETHAQEPKFAARGLNTRQVK